MAKILAPNKKYSGVVGSVTFVNGQGETNKPHLLKWFKKKGYTVEGALPEEKEETKEVPEKKGGKK